MPASVRTPVGNAPIIPVIILGSGFYLAWFAIHWWADTSTVWPTTPVKAVLTGKPLPAPSASPTASATQQAVEQQAINAVAVGPGSSPAAAKASGIPPAVSGSGTANQAIGRLVTGAYGWAPSQAPSEWAALVKLWTQESGWNNTAQNPASGAYGIAQALGHGTGAATQGSVTNEYGGYGISDAMAKAANSGDAASQITWGCQYIKQTYGSPSAAWAHEQSNNWY